MKVGSTFILVVNLDVELSLVDSIIFTIKNGDNLFTKTNYNYDNNTKKFHIPFTQEETLQMEGRNLVEAQINYEDNSVSKSQIGTFYVNGTLATELVNDNTATRIAEDIELLIDGDIQILRGDYNDLINLPTLDGQELKGDMTADGLNLATKDFVEQEIANFDFIKIVTELPSEGLPNRTYLVAKTSSTDNDLYDEYIWANGSWEFLGTKAIEVDLTDYVKNTDFASDTDISQKTSTSKYLSPKNVDYAVKVGLADSQVAWTSEEKSSALALLGGVATSKVSLGAVKDTIPVRDGDGRIYSMAPRFDAHVATKQYVDGLIAGLQAQIDALKG